MAERMENISNKNADESELKIVLTKTEKSVIVISCIVAVVLIVVLSICLPTSPKRTNDNIYYRNYSDLTAEYPSSCLASTTFATINDPYYKWTVSSSFATAHYGVHGIPVAKATIGFQMASVWRDATLDKEKDGNIFINSPDPRILKGIIHKQSKSLIWTMTTNWGMSLRICSYADPSQLDICFYTLPLVLIPDGNTSVLAALMIRMPFADSFEFLPYSNGVHLSNFAPSARALKSLQFDVEKDGDDTWKYVFKGDVCNKANPIFLVSDIVSYLANPLWHCRNYGDGVCSVGVKVEDDENLSKECGACEFFWYTDLQNTTMFTYNPERVALNVTLNGGPQLLKNLPSCIKGWLNTTTTKNASELISKCTAPPRVELHLLDGGIFNLRWIVGGSGNHLLDRRVVRQVKDDVFCGINLTETQDCFKDSTCSMTVEHLWNKTKADGLKDTLYSLASVPTVKAAGDKIWEKNRLKRTTFSISIVTALLTLATTINVVLSPQLQGMENFMFGLIKENLDDNIYGKAGFRTILRVGFVTGTAAWSMWNVFISLEDLHSETADATTTLRHIEGEMILVTTTYSIQVKPTLAIFYAICCFVGVTVVIFSVYVYSRMLHTELEQKKTKKKKEIQARSIKLV